MRRRLVWLALTLCGAGIVTAGCGSSSKSATKPPAASSAAASASSASASAAPTSSPSAASSGGASGNSLAVTGAFQAAAVQSSTQSQCSKSTFASGPLAQVMVVYDTSQTSGPSSSYQVDLDNITPGSTTSFPTTQRNGAVGPMIRFSYNGGNGYLDWGYSAVATAGQPAGSAQGTVTMSPTAQTGTFNLTVSFLGNDSRTIAAGSKPAIHMSGKWSCT